MKVDTCMQAALFLGKTEPLAGFDSAINKQPVTSAIELTELGLMGDECADSRHHGGVDRALHHYPLEHYQFWQQLYPDAPRAWQASAMGENISTVGLTEAEVFIGDRFQLGEAIIEVSQPRSPCFKLSRLWQLPELSSEMQTNARCGWLYRVIQAGVIPENAQLKLIARDSASLSIKQVCDFFFNDPLNRQGLERLVALQSLSERWRNTAAQRLQTGEVEDWLKRLNGPDINA